MTIFLTAVVLRDHLDPRVAVGAGLVAAAIFVAGSSGATRALRIGVTLIAATCVCWAINNASRQSQPPALLKQLVSLVDAEPRPAGRQTSSTCAFVSCRD